MTTKTTRYLHITWPALAAARVRNWLYQRDPIRLIVPLALALLCLLAAGALYRTLARPSAAAEPTRAIRPAIAPLPLLIIATAQPTAALPTADPQLAQELAALRERVAELEARSQAAPPPVPVVVAAPAPAPVYQVDAAAPPAVVDMDQALLDHQRQQAESCAAGQITNAAYCAMVTQWLAAH